MEELKYRVINTLMQMASNEMMSLPKTMPEEIEDVVGLVMYVVEYATNNQNVENKYKDLINMVLEL